MISHVSSTLATQSSGSTLTYSVTVSGTDKLLIVSGYGGVAGCQISGVTFNGVALTKINDVLYTPNSSQFSSWRLVNPASVTANVVVTYNGGGRMCSVASVYNGVDQTTPIGATAKTQQGNSNTISATVNNTVADAWMYAGEEGSNLTASAVTGSGVTTTKRAGQDDAINIADSNGGLATGNRTGGFTGSSNHRGLVVFMINPVATAQNFNTSFMNIFRRI